MKLFTLRNLLILLALAAPSCAGKDYIYYKSPCACEPLINHADIKNV